MIFIFYVLSFRLCYVKLNRILSTNMEFELWCSSVMVPYSFQKNKSYSNVEEQNEILEKVFKFYVLVKEDQ